MMDGTECLVQTRDNLQTVTLEPIESQNDGDVPYRIVMYFTNPQTRIEAGDKMTVMVDPERDYKAEAEAEAEEAEDNGEDAE